MRLAAIYSFNNGEKVVTEHYPHLVREVRTAISSIDETQCKTKESFESTTAGTFFYSPVALNRAFKKELIDLRGWKPIRVPCDYPTTFYLDNYEIRRSNRGAFREMDFVKEKLGIEVQFGKYAFMVYNVCAKMTIFRNLGHIDCGIEIVPVKALVEEMSSGVSYFEQFVWDLETRGVANIDIPVLILGVDAVEGARSDPPSQHERSPRPIRGNGPKHKPGPSPKRPPGKQHRGSQSG
ncbi:MAG TPA: BglII/BstYI family type II restriction endonuclease [Verrucomicrobiae bacterium]|nr:BglII/BstYI family type II restriction endonuclease [Verrucomicrobiae bacterium]